MPLHNHLGALGDVEPALQLEPPALDLLQLAHEVERIHYDAVAYHAVLAIVEDSARHEVQNVLLVSDDDGVPRVGAALEANNGVRLLRQKIYYLALAFIAPLGADQYSVHLRLSSFRFLCLRVMKPGESRLYQI